jgi:uncharacterized membrane protein YfcA
MKLPTWYRVHSYVTFPFTLPMILVPKWFLKLIVDQEPSDVAIALSRLVGAAYLLIAIQTWVISRYLHSRTQLILAKVFCIYEFIGLLVGSTIHFTANDGIARWATMGFFLFFALGYLWFGFIQPMVHPAATADPAPASESRS